jgi:hypothetical protein
LKELEADNRELRAFKENIVQAATAQSGASSIPIACGATEAGATLSGFTGYVSARPNAGTTPPASCSSYISMDDFMASPRSIGPPLELVDDVELNPGEMISAMGLATYHGTPSFETSPRQELGKITKDFHRGAVEPLYGYASAESGGGNGNLDGNGNGSSNVCGWGPGRDCRKGSVDDGRDQALRIAVSNGHVSMVQLLVKHGADVNAPIGRLSRTPLHDAAAGADAKMVELLLKHGADVSMLDAAGMTALQIAVSADNIDVAEVLLRANT